MRGLSPTGRPARSPGLWWCVYSAPHFTTLAGFVAKLEGEIAGVYRDVLLVCDEMGLIGREMFAADWVKMRAVCRADGPQALGFT